MKNPYSKIVSYVKVRKYSISTRIILYVFLGSLGIMIIALIFSFVPASSYFFSVTAIIFFILTLSIGTIALPITVSIDNNKRKKGEIIDEKSTLFQLERLFTISDSIYIKDAARSVNLSSDNLLSFISLHQLELPNIRIDGERIYLASDSPSIDPNDIDWVCPHCGKVNKGPKNMCEECKAKFTS